MSGERLSFVVVSDTHIGAEPSYRLHGIDTAARTRALVDGITNSPLSPRFVFHTGDVATEQPDRAAYRRAARIFESLEVPTYFLAGNHDRSDWLGELLPSAPSVPIETDPRLRSYSFDIDAHRFVALDLRDPDADVDARGVVDDVHLDALRDRFATAPGDVTLFVHFPPLRVDSPWHDDRMILRGGDALHGLLRAQSSRLRGVFFGHVHRAITIQQDGVSYFACPSPCLQFPALPIEEPEGPFEAEPGAAFLWVTYRRDGTWIKHYRIPTPYRDHS
ncbi:MAG: metallophosphoesterase [Planctomycetes bacterium]|nr:metallophosphoesterase [Planctomycetota bacterium]